LTWRVARSQFSRLRCKLLWSFRSLAIIIRAATVVATLFLTWDELEQGVYKTIGMEAEGIARLRSRKAIVAIGEEESSNTYRSMSNLAIASYFKTSCPLVSPFFDIVLRHHLVSLRQRTVFSPAHFQRSPLVSTGSSNVRIFLYSPLVLVE
jgi:hypothetical protein